MSTLQIFRGIGREKKLVSGLMLLGFVAIISLHLHDKLSFEFLKNEHDHLLTLYQLYTVSFILAYLLVYIAYTALCFPGVHLFMLISGAIFGFPLGVVISATGCATGGMITVLWSRYLFKDGVHRILGTRFENISNNLRQEGPYYMFAMHLTTGFPYSMLNLAAGILPLQLRVYLLVLITSQTLAAIAYNYAGMQLESIHHFSDIFSTPLLAVVLLIALTPLLVHLIARKRRQIYYR